MKKIPSIIKEQFTSRNRRNTLTFLVFLGISTLFWFVMTLNDEVQRDLTVKVDIQGMPDDMKLLSSNGSSPAINVTVKDKGGNFIYRSLSNNNTLHLDYRDFSTRNNRLTLNQVQLSTSIRQFFGSTAIISNISPDSLSLPFTTQPPVKVAILPVANVHTQPQFVISGQVKCDIDSVLIYLAEGIDLNITSVQTEPIKATGINDTLVQTVGIIVPAGCRAVPSHVQITVPVEPLVSKTFSIPVELINIPTDINVVTFPTAVDFSCLMPMSLYNQETYPVKAYADFNKREDNIIPLEMSILPDTYLNGSISPSMVEYIIETQQ